MNQRIFYQQEVLDKLKYGIKILIAKNFGLKSHDSHNIIAVGADDESLTDAVNLIIHAQGGVSVADHDIPAINKVLPLPVFGI